MDYEILLRLRELLAQRKDPNSDVEWQDIADYLTSVTGQEYNRTYLRKAFPLYDLYNSAGWVSPPALDNGADGRPEDTADSAGETEAADGAVSARVYTLSGDGSESSELRTTVSDTSKLHDADYLLRLHGYDPNKFELTSAKASQWGGIDKTLYSSKITVRPKAASICLEDIARWFDKLDRMYGKSDSVSDMMDLTRSRDEWDDGDKLLIIPLSDLHFNMQATLFNSGNEYNCDIAERIFLDIIQDVLERTSHRDLSKIVLTIGGDQMDADSPANATTKGTPQQCDKHYWDATEQMYAMTIRAVDMLAERAPVDVIYVPGNHDRQTGFMLARYVDAWFRHDMRVTVDYAPTPRHYYLFGKTLFVFAHDGDVKRLQKLIPDEARSMWSEANFTEVFLQHLHSEALLSEECNMRIQRLPSPVARSVWTNEMGYRSRRQCKSFVYDKELGLQDVLYTVIPE